MAGKSAPRCFIFRINLRIRGPLFLHLILEEFFFFGQIPQQQQKIPAGTWIVIVIY